MRTATVATTGWWTRLLLLVCTLLGLAAMHTIGHGGHGSGHPDGHAVAQGPVLPGLAVPPAGVGAAPKGLPTVVEVGLDVAAPEERPAGVGPAHVDAVAPAALPAVTGASHVAVAPAALPAVSGEIHAREALPAVAHVDAAPAEVRAERPVTPAAAEDATAAGPSVVPVAGDGCPDDGCRHGLALPADDPGGDPGVFGVCLAVLGTLTVTLLLAALLLRWRRPLSGARHPAGRWVGSRAPPGRPVGLRLATVSVLRR